MNKEIMLKKLQKLLDEYNYNWETYALENIIDEWYAQKEPLRQILRNHPRWVEEKDMIVFDIDMERKVNKKAVMHFHDWAINALNLNQDYLGLNSVWTLYNFPGETFVTQDMLDMIKAEYPDFKGAVGQKTSRAMNKLFCMVGLDKHPDYNREFAKYADALNPLKITRHTVISINFLDYLTMSFGNSWASCHTIDKENRRGMPESYSGCYSSGTLSYALDQSSMVFYTVDAKYGGDEYYFEPKINRQMFHFGEDKLVQGRLYPQSCDSGFVDEYNQFRNIVQEVLALCLGVPNLWTLKRGTEACREATLSIGTHYKDYLCYDNCNVSALKDSGNALCMVIGAQPICIECGCRHDTAENINCCAEGHYCEDCGCLVNEDEAYYIDGCWYCGDCVSYCEECREWYHRSDCTWVDSIDGYVCDYCLDQHYIRCEDCDEYHHIDDSTWVESIDGYVCDDCLSDNFERCEGCYEYFRKDDMRYDDENDCYYCNDCYDEVRKNEEECEYEDEAI